jgi:hypothetical protein
MSRQLRVLGKYVGHLIVGAAMFAALLSFGIATNILVQWSEPLVNDSTFGVDEARREGDTLFRRLAPRLVGGVLDLQGDRGATR